MEKKKRILVLTGDAGIASDLKTRLGRLGYTVLESAPPAPETPDAALLDARLREGSAGASVPDLPEPGRTPIVILLPEGRTGVPSADPCRGLCGFLAMPCTDESLGTAVEAALSAGEPARILRRSGEGIRNLLALCGEAVVLTDRGGRILLFPPAAERLFGHAPPVAPGTPFSLLLDGGARDRYAAAAAALLDGGTAEPLALEARRADGTSFPAVLTLSVLAMEEGLCVAVLVRPASGGDLFHTEVRRIAHDINNSLSAIFGYSELARDSLDDRAALEEFTSELIKAGRKARDLAAQLMHLTREGP